MLNVSLTMDHRYFSLGFENRSIGIVLDLNKYSYYTLIEDLELIDIMYQPFVSLGVDERMNIRVNPEVTLYRVPLEHMGSCPFLHTNESIPVDKLEFFKTNENYYGDYCALWKPAMRTKLQEGEKVSDVYSIVYRNMPSRISEQKLRNFKGSELLSNILTKLDVSARVSVPLSNLSVCVRDDLTALLNSANLRWVSPWTQNKTSSYLFLDGDDVVCNDLTTLSRNPGFDAEKTPWLATINPEHGSVVLNFNEKAYDSKLGLLQSLFPDFKAIKITKADALEALNSIASAKNYPEAVDILAKNFMDGRESLQAIVYGEDGHIFEVGRIADKALDNLYIQVGVHTIKDANEREKLSAELIALLYADTGFRGY